MDDFSNMPIDYQPGSLLEHGLNVIGLQPHMEPEGDLLPFYVRVNLAAQLTAGLISYYRHRDFTWAIVHGLMGPVYLGFLGAKAISLEEAKGLEYLFQR